MLELGPIFRSLLRRKTIGVLIAVQIAVVIAILLNLQVGVSYQLQALNQESGIDHQNMFYMNVHIAEPNLNPDAIASIVNADLDYIRKTSGVIDVVQTISVPYSGSGWSMSIEVDPADDIRPTVCYFRMIDDRGLNALGINLLAGRNFRPEEVEWRIPYGASSPNQVLLSQQLAEHLFPDATLAEIVGRQVHLTGPMTVVGVVATSHGPWASIDQVHRIAYVPQKQAFDSSTYVVRTTPGKLEETIRTLEQNLPTLYRNRLIRHIESIEVAKKRLYQGQNASVWVFSVTSIALLFVVVCGMTGMVNFAIRRRTTHIGIRRALGATQFDIMRNLLVEYALILCVGIGIGVPMAIGLNVYLVTNQEFEPLMAMPSALIVMATLAVCLLAVVFPAQQVSKLDPAQITRSV